MESEKSVQYFPSGINIQNLETNSNDAPVIYKINEKEYIGASKKNYKGNYTHNLKDVWINSDKITIQSIKQNNNNDFMFFIGFWTNLDGTQEWFSQSEELKKYLTENPSIDITNLTAEQKIELLKNCSCQYEEGIYIYCFGTINEPNISSEPIVCNSEVTLIPPSNQTYAMLLWGDSDID